VFFPRSNRRFEVYDCIHHNDIIRATVSVSSITIRHLEPAFTERLRFRAAEHGHSMEAGARRILRASLRGSWRPSGRNLYGRIDARFAPLGGVNLEFSHANPFANRPASTDVRPGHQLPVRHDGPKPGGEVGYDVRRAASTTLP
jgi:plasmid stability protein